MTTLNTTATELFNIIYNTATPVEYNPEWANGTGYLNGVTNDQDIMDANINSNICFKDEHGRRAVGFCTPKGIVVLFERYKGDDTRFVSNTPSWRQDRLWVNFEVKTETGSLINTAHQIVNMVEGVELIRKGNKVPVLTQSEPLPEYLLEDINREFA